MPNNTYLRTLQHFSEVPWAISEAKLREIRAFVLGKLRAGLDEDYSFSPAAYEAKGRPASTTQGNVAVINVYGVIAQRMDMMSQMSGGCSIENVAKDFQAAVSNPSIKAIVLNIDSPGGCVFGVQEFADQIMNARAQKHVVAIANSMAASAAYWIAAAADEVVVTPSGQVGSIGVYTIHEDWSKALEAEGVSTTIIQAGKYKTEGNPYAPLTEEALAAMQADINFYYDAFIGAVANGRGVSASVVKNTYGQGRVLTSKDAKAAGMVDRVDTLEGVLAKLGVGSTTAQTPMRGMHAGTAERELELLLQS